ncbi:InlB B-repeat-containing protein [Clostridiaceae bacterium HSG29]|nr:InlB B-repeat-containing protein [Clostridiaceae bacterium HSG29]
MRKTLAIMLVFMMIFSYSTAIFAETSSDGGFGIQIIPAPAEEPPAPAEEPPAPAEEPPAPAEEPPAVMLLGAPEGEIQAESFWDVEGKSSVSIHPSTVIQQDDIHVKVIPKRKKIIGGSEPLGPGYIVNVYVDGIFKSAVNSYHFGNKSYNFIIKIATAGTHTISAKIESKIYSGVWYDVEDTEDVVVVAKFDPTKSTVEAVPSEVLKCSASDITVTLYDEVGDIFTDDSTVYLYKEADNHTKYLGAAYDNGDGTFSMEVKFGNVGKYVIRAKVAVDDDGQGEIEVDNTATVYVEEFSPSHSTLYVDKDKAGIGEIVKVTVTPKDTKGDNMEPKYVVDSDYEVRIYDNATQLVVSIEDVGEYIAYATLNSMGTHTFRAEVKVRICGQNSHPHDQVVNDFEAECQNQSNYVWLPVDTTQDVEVVEVFTVYFNKANGQPIVEVPVLDGDTVGPIGEPTNGLHIFKYWHENGIDPAAEIVIPTMFDFTTPITHDVSLIAIWQERYTVSFAPNGGSGDGLGDQIVVEGEHAIRPPNPTKYGKIFKFWTVVEERGKTFSEDGVIAEGSGFDFEHTAIIAPITLKARWRDAPNFWITVDGHHDVYFNSDELPNDNNWATVDAHIVELEDKNLIAVKGWQRENSCNMMPGFIASLDTGEGEPRVETNGDWYYTTTEPVSNQWRNRKTYHPPEGEIWYRAFDITSDGVEEPYWPSMPSGNAHWIWAHDDTNVEFRIECNDEPVEFETPVWFRNLKVKNYNEYEVSFDIMGGEEPAPDTQYIGWGGYAQEPMDPIKVGYEFEYWTENDISASSTIEVPWPDMFDFENTKIKKNTQLYAVWCDEDDVRVRFVKNNGEGGKNIWVEYNDFVAPLDPEPTLDGYRLDAWVQTNLAVEEEGSSYPKPVIGEPFDFENTRITDFTKLKARWIKTYIVTFDTGEGSAVGPWEVDEGVSYEAPDPPTWEGHTFDKWVVVDDLDYVTPNFVGTEIETEFIFPAVFDDDTDLLAKYTEDEPDPPVQPRTRSYSPKAVDDKLTTDMNTPVSVSTSKLMSNDSHANNFESVQGAVNGTVKLSGNTVKFTPDTDFAGTAKFKYTIEYKGKYDTGTVTVDVNAVIIEEETPLGASNRYIIGDENGNARAFDPVTRAELATMYARLLSLNYQATTIPRYMDVYSTMWHASYINILKATGILVGKDDIFDPEGLITRAELASSIARYYEFVGETFKPIASTLTDIKGHVAQSDIEIVVAQEMMGAYSGTLFLPDRLISRVEAIKILNKLFDIQPRIPEKPSFKDMTTKSFGFEAIEAAAEDTIFTTK